MFSEGSVTQWIDRLKAGDEEAAQRVWERYYGRLVQLARKKLRGVSRRVADEEDAVISAFDSFCRGATEGRFPRLDDRNDLWQVLIVLTCRKAINQAQHLRRLKRGGGDVRGESAFSAPGDASGTSGIAQVVGREPTPEFAALVAEQLRLLHDQLGDPVLREIALWKLDGYTNIEIAGKIGRTTRTVERKLQLIRKRLEKAMSDEECSSK